MDKILKKIVAFTQMRYMKVITNGFMATAAISIAGSIFSLIRSFPVTPWQTFLTTSGLADLLSIPILITSDLMSLYVVIAMAYTLIKTFEGKDAFGGALVALGAFMILTPFTANANITTEAGETVSGVVSNVIPLSALGAQGIFLAMFVGIAAARLYVFIIDRGWKISMPASVPPTVSRMFENMIPGGLVFLAFLLLRQGFSLTSFGTMQSFIYSILQAPLSRVAGGTAGVAIYLTVGKLLWLLGIHGDMVAYAGMAPVMRAAMAENQTAFAIGAACPYPAWALATACQNVCVLGITLCMLFFARSKQYKSLSRIAAPTSLFNITEPIVFGFPLIMNPIMAIPFVISPAINLFLSLGVMNLGLVKMVTGAAASNALPTPIYFAFLNSHWSGFVWGLVLVALNMAIALPFFKFADRQTRAREVEAEKAEALKAAKTAKPAEA